ncbi:MAG: hypothetical protein ABI855_03310 [Bacteroidota bacterium]
MTTELTKQQIASLLETLQEQYHLIKTKEDKIPQIELDLLLNNTRNLYEALLQLNKINRSEIELLKQEVVIEDRKPEDLKIDEVRITEPGKKEIIAEIESRHDEIKIAPEIIQETKVEEISEKISAAVDQKIMEERTATINKTSKPVSKNGNLFEEATVVVNKFEGKQTVHDKITKSKEDKSWNEKIQNQPVTDLKKSIGINEKFKFVNELFDGHLQEYNESIDFLNNCKTLEEAQNFIDQSLTPKFNWKKESSVCQSLLLLIQRKFNS